MELLAIKEGLIAAFQKRHLRVIVESDSPEGVNLINGFPVVEHPLLSVILECKRLHKRLRSSSITFVPRTYNYAADCIAKLRHVVYNKFETVWFDVALFLILEEVRKDNIM